MQESFVGNMLFFIRGEKIMKSDKILKIFELLLLKKEVNYSIICQEFDICLRSFQNYISDIRCYLVDYSSLNCELLYDTTRRTYCFKYL